MPEHSDGSSTPASLDGIMQEPVFSAEQVRWLKVELSVGARLTDSEIAKLESEGLPVIANYRRQLPEVAAVRQQLRDLRAALHGAHRALRLTSLPGDDAAATEALGRLAHTERSLAQPPLAVNAYVAPDSLGPKLLRLLQDLASGVKVVDAALEVIPKDQRRHRAHWQIVEAVHVAVPRIRPSRSSSDFVTMLQVCLAAADGSSGIPRGEDYPVDDLIRRYLKALEGGGVGPVGEQGA